MWASQYCTEVREYDAEDRSIRLSVWMHARFIGIGQDTKSGPPTGMKVVLTTAVDKLASVITCLCMTSIVLLPSNHAVSKLCSYCILSLLLCRENKIGCTPCNLIETVMESDVGLAILH